MPRALCVSIQLAVYYCSRCSAAFKSNAVVKMKQDLATPRLKHRSMQQTDMAQSVCMASSRAIAAAASAAAAAATATAAQAAAAS